MKKFFLIIVLVIFALLFYFIFVKIKSRTPELKVQTNLSSMIKLKSPAFSEGQIIPEKYTCKGENINPALQIEGVPEAAKSLVLIVDDPDSPTGTWQHWLVWNVDPKINTIDEGTVPEKAVVGTNDFAKVSYGGPCPGFGTHRYYFRLYALDTSLDLPSAAKRRELDTAIKGHIVDETSLMGKFSK